MVVNSYIDSYKQKWTKSITHTIKFSVGVYTPRTHASVNANDVENKAIKP